MAGQPLSAAEFCLPDGTRLMVHQGLPDAWAAAVLIGMGLVLLMALRGGSGSAMKGGAVTASANDSPVSERPLAAGPRLSTWRAWAVWDPWAPLSSWPLLGPVIRLFTGSPWPLIALKILFVALFGLVVAAGLFGTPYAERNLATTLTWTVWWSLVVISVLFVGTGWCAVCPWDSLAGWLVKRRLWRRNPDASSLEMVPPRWLRSVWPALGLFVGLTWLELGVGVTADPSATALLALVMVLLATTSLALFQRKAFCRYFCPVGRTLGFYAQLSPLELRPVSQPACQACQTLECYHGSATVEPCPTSLTMGRFAQNTFCASCGHCVISCPEKNVSWRLRPLAAEAGVGARPHWDEAWFMVGLLGLTSFHGVTMLPQWEAGLRAFGRWVGDSGRLLISFSFGMLLCLAAACALFGLAVWLTGRLGRGEPVTFKIRFATLSFATLPVAFAYHLAHNISHLAREGSGLAWVFLNPFGTGTLPMGATEQHARMMDPLLPSPLIFAIQALFLIGGFWLALRILQQRAAPAGAAGSFHWASLAPMLLFLGGFTGFNLWLLAQPMVMRL